MARRRRRWGLRFGLIVVIALILGWQGWGLLPLDGGEEPDGESEAVAPSLARVPQPGAERQADAETAAPVPPAVPPDVIAADDGGRGTRRGQAEAGAGDPGAAGGGDVGRGNAPRGDAGSAADTEPVSAEVADRLFALQELIREAVATDRLGDGFRALEDLEQITRADGPPALRAEGRQILGNALTATVLQLREAVRGGRVLEARRLLGALRGTHHARVSQALDMMAGGEGWPPLGQGAEASGDIPEPKPLAVERRVLVEWEEQIVLGRVSECGVERVTVRLQRDDGVVFPTLPRVRVAPVDARGEEAVQQGLAALRAGDRDLAWLWLCRAHAAGGSGEMVRQLGRLIGG